MNTDSELKKMFEPLHLPQCRGRVLIAGPCSAETPGQLMQAARLINSYCPGAIFRAGVWKPRTSPESFEGVGERALQWLVNVREQTGMLLATEVASPLHVKLAAEAGIDLFWIGARTAANPFAMQEVAEAIGEIAPHKPVLVKNPVSPDLDLWIGAFARLLKQGVTHLGGIHRGFSVYKSRPYRNAPIWQIPLELHRRFPALTLIHDPSHTGGRREHISHLSQQAMDMGFSGLMIESHTQPEIALSDGGQQITPEVLHRLWQTLKIRDAQVSKGTTLEELRCQIDELDNELLSILARRMELCRRIGDFKLANEMPVVQHDRYNRLLTSLLSQGARLGLDADFLTDLLERVHAESVRTQLSIVNKS